MLRRIFSYMKQYKKYAYLALICIAVEAAVTGAVVRIVDAQHITRQTIGRIDRKSTRLNSSHDRQSRMPSSA